MWLWTEAFDKASVGLSFVAHSRAWFWCSCIWHAICSLWGQKGSRLILQICPRTGFYLARSQPKIKSATLKNLCLAQKRTKRIHAHQTHSHAPECRRHPPPQPRYRKLAALLFASVITAFICELQTHAHTRTFKHIYKRMEIQEKKETVPS